jgi:hypothetical protein
MRHDTCLELGYLARPLRSPWIFITSFGTRGSQVQIRPLRPSFFSRHEMLTGNDMEATAFRADAVVVCPSDQRLLAASAAASEMLASLN